MSDLNATQLTTDLFAIPARPKTYWKGPDVMSKSEHTRTRYRAQWKNQTSLDAFGFKRHNTPASNLHEFAAPGGCHSNDKLEMSLPIIPQAQTACEFVDESTALESEKSDVLLTEGPSDPAICLDICFGPNTLEGESGEAVMDDEAAEGWEDELDMTASGSAGDIHNWKVLRDQIKADLKKQSKTLPLSQVHQLLILSSFATLRLKGMSRISASLEIARQ